MLIPLLFFSQFSLADSLFAKNHYDLARIEYKREFFFYPELKTNQEKRLNFGISLIKSDDLKGLREFNNIINDFPDLEPEVKIKMAKCYLDLGDFYQACDLLNQTDEKKLLGFTYLLDDKLFSARDLFITTGDYEISNEINAYISQPQKSMRTATLLSLVCPGAGDVYAGNIKLGIMDFLLNFGSGYLMYNAIKQKKYVDAILVFNFLFQRFYLGSIHNAQKSVEQRNREHRQKWLKHMQNKHFQDIDINY
ncbi:hypothetical protein KAS56_02215 [candidate division WOR-3 bacterium]|nr:hypothetical protein [candidate division WOR-3 bacterium]